MLISLKKLWLQSSVIDSLPPSIGQLKNLEELHLGVTENLFELPKEFADLESLTRLDLSGSSTKSIPSSLLHKLGHSKGCKQAMLKTGFGGHNHSDTSVASTIIPELWPRLLSCATLAFGSQGIWVQTVQTFSGQNWQHQVSRQDAIHQLLLSGREQFIGLLI